MDAIIRGWASDSRKVKNVHNTKMTDHFRRGMSGRRPLPSTPDYTPVCFTRQFVTHYSLDDKISTNEYSDIL